METIHKQLLTFQSQVNAIKKSATNPHFKKNYADLNSILDEVKPLLTDLGLVLTQPIEGGKVKTVITKDKESIFSEISLPEGLNAQQLGSAITYFRRYTLLSLLALSTEDDDATEATELPWLNKPSDNYNKVLDALTNGKATVTQVKTKYRLSKEMEAELNNVNK